MPLLVAALLAFASHLGLPLPGDVKVERSEVDIARAYDEAKRLVDEYEGDPAGLGQAKALIRAIRRSRPDHAGAYALEARIERLQAHVVGDRYVPEGLARARALADKAIALDPALPEAYRAAAWVALADQRLGDAKVMAARAQALEPDGELTGFLLAKIDLKEGRLDAALARYVALLERATTDERRASAQMGRKDVFCARKAYDACEAAYREVARLRPGSAWTKGNFASFLVWRKKYDEAIEQASAALALMDYPAGRRTLSDAHAGKGLALLEAKRLDDARGHVERAVAADPSNAAAHFAAGQYWVARSRRATGTPADRDYVLRAEQQFAMAAGLDPDNETYREWHELSVRQRRTVSGS